MNWDILKQLLALGSLVLKLHQVRQLRQLLTILMFLLIIYLLGRCDEVDEQPSESTKAYRKEVMQLQGFSSDSDLQVDEFRHNAKSCSHKISSCDNMNRIRILRLKAGLNQKQLGAAINCAQTTISNWENETKELSISHARTIAHYFNVSIDYLVGNDVIYKPIESIDGLKAEIMMLLDGLSDSELQRVGDFIAGLKAAQIERV